mmetsp:Transcript_9576/g.21210  ORF Transcript_9576/g.21210 Transcript_9576/m.21210 type:complete len:536 (-) Transcript_9576:94-1701(-)|eukprot:CAMPEP_0173182186 /NCGR_PEP_ID=MMETSP1141-20130122/7695_1 /TAXON_ID=483371 /ORGANISM="non described non described, Strain CCMP2298" /LENGTH=535 /DNA_ID=CAMNT_0014105247 /DNA_START=99 /DNA_END=1706 /DNA_ORIENTATION=+
MFCGISGEVPLEPVVTKTGVLYEKRLIEKYVKENGKCAVTGEELSAEDLLPLKVSQAVRPRPISGTSIPGLLSAFQNEWDEVMLETFTLRQHLDATRQELAQALYQHDAACRVVARLMQERNEARQALSQVQAQVQVRSYAPTTTNSNGNGAADVDVDVEMAQEEVGGLDDTVLGQLTSTCSDLSAARKARKGAAALGPSKEAMGTLAQVESHTPHKADSKSGVTCLAVHSAFTRPSSSSKGKRKATEEVEGEAVAAVLSGGTDKNVLLTEQVSGKLLAKCAGHTKRVSTVAFLAPLHTAGSTALLSGSADKTVRVWTDNGSGAYDCAWAYDGHDAEVASVCAHPSGLFAVSAAADGWHFLDVEGTACLQTQACSEALTCAALHPDGLILGTGTAAGALRIWDVRTRESPSALLGHAAPLACAAFSENGYLAASGAEDGVVKLWDLRKLASTHTLELGSGPASSVAFDSTGVFLAVGGGGSGGAGLQVRVAKDWSLCAQLDGAHSKQVLAVAWAQHGRALVSGGMDRTIRVFSPE